MQNVVPVEATLADRAVAERRDAYAVEARRFIDAALAVMRESGAIDPAVRDVVREAGLSNQAFYRHFPSRDALLLAVLADGQQRLVSYVVHRTEGVDDPALALARWVEAVMAQARSPEAAERTRPFAINGSRLRDRFPDETAAYREQLIDTLRPIVPDRDDARLVHELVMARMNDALLARRVPGRKEIARLVDFCRAATGPR
jgi:AcrR family transcriptional regulator